MEFIAITLNFSAQTTSIATQENIESKLEKKKKKSRGAKGTLKTLVFIDDVNMPAFTIVSSCFGRRSRSLRSFVQQPHLGVADRYSARDLCANSIF